MKERYSLRPLAKTDLRKQAYYYSFEASEELGFRFLKAAHDTFTLLAEHPEIGWLPNAKSPGIEGFRMFRVTGFEKVLILYQPHPRGLDILRVVFGANNLPTQFRDS